MPSRRYWKKFRRPGTGVFPDPNVAIVWSDTQYLLLPERTWGNEAYSDSNQRNLNVIWARPNRVGLLWDGFNNDWWEYDFENGIKINTVATIGYINPVFDGNSWIFERWRLVDSYTTCGDRKRYWESPPQRDVGVSHGEDANVYYVALAIDRQGGRAWVLAPGAVNPLAQSAINPFSCTVQYWNVSALNLVAIAYMDGVLYGATDADVYALDPAGNHSLVWQGGGGNFLWGQNGVLYNINANAEIIGFYQGKSFVYETLPSMPAYVNVFV